MKIVTREDSEETKMLINEFIVTHEIDSKESIPIEFLKYLRSVDVKIEDGELLNDLCEMIEQKLTPKGFAIRSRSEQQ